MAAASSQQRSALVCREHRGPSESTGFPFRSSPHTPHVALTGASAASRTKPLPSGSGKEHSPPFFESFCFCLETNKDVHFWSRLPLGIGFTTDFVFSHLYLYFCICIFTNTFVSFTKRWFRMRQTFLKKKENQHLALMPPATDSEKTSGEGARESKGQRRLKAPGGPPATRFTSLR